jgi:hypothetical protein
MKRVDAVLIAFLLGSGCREAAPAVQTTTGRHQEWVTKSLDDHLTRIAPDGHGQVTFDSTGAFRSGTDLEPARQFTLGVGQTFYRPDHHGSMTLMVEEMRPSAVVLSYQVEFHEASFGQNQVTIDEGRIELPYLR